AAGSGTEARFRVPTSFQPSGACRVQTRVVKRVLMLVPAASVFAGMAFASPPAMRTYRNGSLTFSYPAAWHLREWRPGVGQLRFAVYLSNARVRSPCVREYGGLSCSDPLRPLRPAPVLATWT